MDRRRFLAFTFAVGSSFSLPVNRCLASLAEAGAAEAPASVLDAPRKALLAVLTELIIPQTDTPGAIAAGVPQFIEFMLDQGFAEADRDRFVSGLDDVDARSHRESGARFVDLPEDRQVAILQQVEAAGRAQATAGDPGFFRVLKELTLIGYYTSEPGSTQEARYVPMPGRFEACVPLEPGDRAFADGTPLDMLI